MYKCIAFRIYGTMYVVCQNMITTVLLCTRLPPPRLVPVRVYRGYYLWHKICCVSKYDYCSTAVATHIKISILVVEKMGKFYMQHRKI